MITPEDLEELKEWAEPGHRPCHIRFGYLRRGWIRNRVRKVIAAYEELLAEKVGNDIANDPAFQRIVFDMLDTCNDCLDGVCHRHSNEGTS